MHFADPEYFWLLLLIPAALAWYWYKLRHYSVPLQMSSTAVFKQFVPGWKNYARYSLFGLRMLAVGLLILALARPQTNLNRQDISVEGIDIMLATDISSSMLAEDLRPNRIEAAKEVAVEFISSRPDDRIGLVVFSGESFTQCPLTSNHALLINLFKEIGVGMIDDGTAIGDGLATAVNRLKESKAKSKVIILLTDGVNNMGSIDPQSAAEIAELYGIRIYTIGVGTMGTALVPVRTQFGIQYQRMEVQIDEARLQKISALTNGKYFRATNKQKLEQVYKEIDRLEKSKIDVTEFSRKKEEFLAFVIFALVLLTLEFMIRFVVLKLVP
ncbi:MAG: VWA domain-containing protein [Bacteroidales bacterium]|nr:VWA domain-containing protein [Bacteroidales bacterium]